MSWFNLDPFGAWPLLLFNYNRRGWGSGELCYTPHFSMIQNINHCCMMWSHCKLQPIKCTEVFTQTKKKLMFKNDRHNHPLHMRSINLNESKLSFSHLPLIIWPPLRIAETGGRSSLSASRTHPKPFGPGTAETSSLWCWPPEGLYLPQASLFHPLIHMKS